MTQKIKFSVFGFKFNGSWDFFEFVSPKIETIKKSFYFLKWNAKTYKYMSFESIRTKAIQKAQEMLMTANYSSVIVNCHESYTNWFSKKNFDGIIWCDGKVNGIKLPPQY